MSGHHHLRSLWKFFPIGFGHDFELSPQQAIGHGRIMDQFPVNRRLLGMFRRLGDR
jgi:hypothetical protein